HPGHHDDYAHDHRGLVERLRPEHVLGRRPVECQLHESAPEFACVECDPESIVYVEYLGGIRATIDARIPYRYDQSRSADRSRQPAERRNLAAVDGWHDRGKHTERVLGSRLRDTGGRC